MSNFTCRVCGCNDYWRVDSASHSCKECGVIFTDPLQFSLPVIKVKTDNDDVEIPSKAHDSDVGYDVKSIIDIVIEPNQTVMIPTGLSVDLPPNVEIQVRPRSGMAKKHGITITNSPGTIDPGYKGPCNVLLRNTGDTPYEVSVGDRIAQFVPSIKMPYKLEKTSDVGSSDRNETGYGDSGK